MDALSGQIAFFAIFMLAPIAVFVTGICTSQNSPAKVVNKMLLRPLWPQVVILFFGLCSQEGRSHLI